MRSETKWDYLLHLKTPEIANINDDFYNKILLFGI